MQTGAARKLNLARRICKSCRNSARQEKRDSDPVYRMRSNFASYISKTISDKSFYHCFDLLHYSKEDLVCHLESQFDENMTWENYGDYWHIDHIIPQSFFNFDSYKDDEFKQCWSLSNLRPLKVSENCAKCDKLISDYEKILVEIKEEINESC